MLDVITYATTAPGFAEGFELTQGRVAVPNPRQSRGLLVIGSVMLQMVHRPVGVGDASHKGSDVAIYSCPKAEAAPDVDPFSDVEASVEVGSVIDVSAVLLFFAVLANCAIGR